MYRSTASFFSSFTLACALSLVVACGSSSGGTSGSGGRSDGSGGSGSLNIGGSDPLPKDPNDPRDVPVRQKMCDANGENCTCLRLALLGTLDSAANNKDTQPFIDWLNAKSGGTATVTMVSTKPTLSAEWLANYDVLLVANVNGWAFSADEKAAVQKWSHDEGGGIISLTGFVSTASEPADTSQLISFSGMSYTAARTAENGQAKPVYYKGGTTDLKECLAWTGIGIAGGVALAVPAGRLVQTLLVEVSPHDGRTLALTAAHKAVTTRHSTWDLRRVCGAAPHWERPHTQ